MFIVTEAKEARVRKGNLLRDPCLELLVMGLSEIFHPLLLSDFKFISFYHYLYSMLYIKFIY